MHLTHVFVPLVKAEKQADGTLLVSGPATTSSLDRDEQYCDPAWLDEAMPQWFGEGGNVREMHQHIAAGVAVSYEKKADGVHWIEALVVDPGSVAKVENNVLKGFSIGIKGARIVKSEIARNGAIVDGKIIEVSLVDRPANPDCLLQLAKSDDAGQIVPVEQVLVEGPEAAAVVAQEIPAEVVELPTPAESPETEEESVEIAAEISTPAAPVQAEQVLAASQHVRAQAQQVMDVLSTLGLRTVKADDESSDITSAQAAIAAIARLIQSEAEGLVAGDLDEAYDIDTLLCAVSALRWFIASEQEEEASKAEAVEPVSSEPAEQVAKSEDSATIGVEEPSAVTVEKVQALIAEALAEVNKAHEAETESLRAELAKVKAEPIPGGPVRVPTQTQKALAADHDSRLILKAAQEYEERADQTTDRVLAEGYRRLAEAERAKLTTR